MVKPVEKYFVCANSSRGFVSFFPSVLKEMEKVYIIKGGPGTGKSTIMKKIGEYFRVGGESVEHICCSSDPNSLDGVIIRSKKAAVVDGTSPHIVEPKAPGAVEEYVNLGISWDSKKLSEHREKIIFLAESISHMYNKMYEELALAKKIHDRWERIYIDNLDFEEVNAIGDGLMAEIFKNADSDKSPGTQEHRFFGAMTPDGYISYLEDLSKPMKTRYFIKGRPGTGKSTLMKKVAETGMAMGYNTEVYHCSLDPDSLDMVLLPELSVCIFDATPPHELFPSREGDVILDLYTSAVRPDTDAENSEILSIIKREYSNHISAAVDYLAEACSLHKDLEKFYIDAVNYHVADEICEELIKKIENGI